MKSPIATLSASPTASSYPRVSGLSVAFVQSLLAWDSLAFGAICLLDMLSTMYWVRHGVAYEANPWLAMWLHRGMGWFAAVKLMSFVPTLVIAAYCRAKYPKLVTLALRVGLAAYVVIYVTSIAGQLR